MSGPVTAKRRKPSSQDAIQQSVPREQSPADGAEAAHHHIQTLAQPTASAGTANRARAIRALQRTIGNRATNQLAQQQANGPVQPKFSVGPPGDMYEREADSAADRVAAGQPVGRLSRLPAGGLQQHARRQPEAEEEGTEEEETVEAQFAGNEKDPQEVQRTVMLPPEPHHRSERHCATRDLPSQRMEPEQSREISENQPSQIGDSPILQLDNSSRRRISEVVGDLSESPQLHMGNGAVRATEDLGARGFAYKNHVVIDSSRYPPSSRDFEKLLVHELTHVRQYQEKDLGSSRETEATAAERKIGGHVNHRSSLAANSSVSLTPDHIEAFHLDLETSEVAILLDDGSRITGQVVDTNLRPGRYFAHWDNTRRGLQFEPWPTSEEVISFNISGTVAFRTRFASLRERISASSPVPFTVSSGAMLAEEARPTTETQSVAAQSDDALLHELEPTQDALDGIYLYPAIAPDELPRTDGVDFGTEFRLGVYIVFPQIRRHQDGSRTVAYCIAHNTRTNRNEFLIGPGNIEQFRDQINLHTDIAALSYITTPHGEQPPAYIVESWRAQASVLRGDSEGYWRHLEQGWGELVPEREAIFEEITSGLRSLQRQGIARLEAQANELSEPDRSRALAEIRLVEAISEIFIRLMLALTGVVAGVVHALISMVVGLFRLLVGIIEGILLFFYGFIDEGERFNRWASEVDEALARLPAALRLAIDNWLAEFEQASEDRQTIMIGELTGQIIAIIGTFGATASRAGAAPQIVARLEGAAPRLALAGGGELAPAGAAVTIDVATPVAAVTGVGTAVAMVHGAGEGLPEGTQSVVDEPQSGSSEPEWVEAPEPIQSLERFARTHDPMEAYVYRIRNANGDVIYYGISTDPISRLRAHIRTQGWGHEIQRIEVIDQAFRRPQALALETDLIREAFREGRRLYNQVDDTVSQGLGSRGGSFADEIEVPSPNAPWVSIERAQ